MARFGSSWCKSVPKQSVVLFLREGRRLQFLLPLLLLPLAFGSCSSSTSWKGGVNAAGGGGRILSGLAFTTLPPRPLSPPRPTLQFFRWGQQQPRDSSVSLSSSASSHGRRGISWEETTMRPNGGENAVHVMGGGTRTFIRIPTAVFAQRQGLPPVGCNREEGNNGDPNNKRRKKKNKYAQFSKTDRMSKDPLETLMEESYAKRAELESQSTKKKGKSWEQVGDKMRGMGNNGATTPDLSSPIPGSSSSSRNAGNREDGDGRNRRERDKRVFPNTESIDPYDPTTYGFIELGTIRGPHGVHGWCKLSSETDFALQGRICVAEPSVRHLKPPNRRSPREVILQHGRHTVDDVYLVKLDGVDDRDDATRLRGSIMYGRVEEDRHVVEENMGDDEYLVSDLVGLDVFLELGFGDDDGEGGSAHREKGDGDGGAITHGAPDDDSLGGSFVGTVKGVVLSQDISDTPGLGQDLLEVQLPRRGGREGLLNPEQELVLIPFVPQIVPRVDIPGKAIYITPPDGLLDLTYVRTNRVRIRGYLPPGRD